MNTDSAPQPSAAESIQVPQAHLQILRRAGKVVITFGAILLAAELDKLIRAPKGFVHLNFSWLLFVIAGLLLVRDDLRAAALFSWLSALLIPIYVIYAPMQLFLAPFDFTLVQLRLAPGSVLRTLCWPIAVGVSLAWLLRELRRQPVLEARVQAGRGNPDPRIPALLGVAVSVAACFFISLGIRGENAIRAKAAVAQKLGPNYKYWVNSVSFRSGRLGKSVSASVIVYNHREIRSVPVQWTEDRLGHMSQLMVGLPDPEVRLSGPEAWTIKGTTYRVESTTLLTCGNGERLLTVSAHVDFTPNNGHKPIAMLLAQYAVEHGYADRALNSWSNSPPHAQLAAVGVSLIDPRSTPGQVMGFRYNFGFPELGQPVKTGEPGTR